VNFTKCGDRRFGLPFQYLERESSRNLRERQCRCWCEPLVADDFDPPAVPGDGGSFVADGRLPVVSGDDHPFRWRRVDSRRREETDSALVVPHRVNLP